MVDLVIVPRRLVDPLIQALRALDFGLDAIGGELFVPAEVERRAGARQRLGHVALVVGQRKNQGRYLHDRELPARAAGRGQRQIDVGHQGRHVSNVGEQRQAPRVANAFRESGLALVQGSRDERHLEARGRDALECGQ